MVRVHDLRRRMQRRRRETGQHLGAVGHVLLRRVALVAEQPRGLVEDAVRHRQFADIVNARGLRQLRHLDHREAQLARDRFRKERDAPAVIAGARIAQVDDRRQRVDRRPFLSEQRFGRRLLVG